jgi:hypothetical protein
MGLLRSLVTLAVLVAFVLLGITVPLGSRTLFGHLKNIVSSDETQELVDGVRSASGPAVERVRRGVNAGIEEAKRDVGNGGAKTPAEPDSPETE